jgi:PAS domain S-box-containing protein
MMKADETIEKLLTIEKAVNEMVTLRQGILELKESEASRQKALDELRANENRHRILWENLPQQIFMKDKDSVYILCSQLYAADLKRKTAEIIGKTDEDLYPRELAEKYRSDDKRIMNTGHAEDTEESFIREGQSFVVRSIKTPLKDEKGEIVGILGISWDITEQRRKEDKFRKNCESLEGSVANLTGELQGKNRLLEREMAERREMEERLRGAEGLRRIFEKMATSLILMEENKVISLANIEFEKLSGYSKREVEGKKSLMDFFTQTDSERIAEYYGTQGANPEAVIRDMRCHLLGKDGDNRDVSLTLCLIPETKRSIAALMDITKTKRAEERIEELEKIYVSLIQNTNEGIALVQDGILKSANPRILEILGYTKEELTSKPFREFILPEDREWFEINPDKPTNGDLNHTSSFRMVHKDGGVRWLENKGSLVHWGKDMAVLHFLSDISSRKQAEEELRISIEPFRKLVNVLEKYLFALNGNASKSQKVELS